MDAIKEMVQSLVAKGKKIPADNKVDRVRLSVDCCFRESKLICWP